jgi:hypothetical protein
MVFDRVVYGKGLAKKIIFNSVIIGKSDEIPNTSKTPIFL